ncbi:MAG: hypothetical protein ACJ8D9_21010 [Xanthobacteraceae bacterium]
MNPQQLTGDGVPVFGHTPPPVSGDGSPISPSPIGGNPRTGDGSPGASFPNVGNSHTGDGPLVSSLPAADHSFSGDALLAFASLTMGHASSADAPVATSALPGIAAGIDPNALAGFDVGWDFHGAGWVQVTAADVADPNLDSRADVSGVTYWEPVDSQPAASPYEVAYWFEPASFGDFFL